MPYRQSACNETKLSIGVSQQRTGDGNRVPRQLPGSGREDSIAVTVCSPGSPADMKVKLDEDLQLTVLEGSTVVLDAKNGVYLGTNDVGTRIIELLRTDGDAERAVAILLDEYDVSEEALRRDMQKLMDDLKSRGLLTVMDDGAAEAPQRASLLKAVLRKFGVGR
jgi:hypothetical protein